MHFQLLPFSFLLWSCTQDKSDVQQVDSMDTTLSCMEELSFSGEPLAFEVVGMNTTESTQIEFSVSIDIDHEAWIREGFHPISEPVSILGVPEDWEVVAVVKELRSAPDQVRLDLYISPLTSGLNNVALTVLNDSSISLRDYRVDPWAEPTEERVFSQERIVAGGYSHFSFGLEKRELQDLEFRIEGILDSLESASSSPIVIDSTSNTLWTVFHDSVASISLDDGTRNNFTVPGTPNSVSITPDGHYALTVSPECNQVILIDTSSNNIVQVLGEEDGIGREPKEILVSPDGARAYVSSYVGDEITVLDRTETGFTVTANIAVGRRPTGLSISPDGTRLFVAHFLPRGPISDNESWVSAIDTENLELVHEIALRDQFNYDRSECVQQIEIFSSWTAEELSIEGVPKMLSGVFLDPSGQNALVPGLKSPGFPALEGDISSWGVGQTRKGANNPAVLYPLTFSRKKEGEVLPWQMAQDVIDTTKEFLQCALPTNDIEFVTPREASVLGEEREELYFYPGTITPGPQTPFMPIGYIDALGYSKGGRRIFALSSVADMFAVLDGMTHQSVSKNHLTLTGSNPIGIAVSDDGTRAYVAYRNSSFVSVINIEEYAKQDLPKPIFTPYWLQTTSQVAVSLATRETLTRDMSTVEENLVVEEIDQLVVVDQDPMDQELRNGKILFESSNPEKYPGLSGHPHASCASCHPAGASDGSAWGTVEGERRTNSLRGGVAGRGWLHYSATHANIEEFIDVVLPERLGGAGLDDKDLQALSRYLAFGIPKIQGPKTDPVLVEKGETVFEQNCASCHQGDSYSSGNPDPEDKFGGANHERDPYLYDIGTKTDRAGVILGPPFAAIFPEPAGSILRLLSGDRDLGEGDVVEDILQFEPRPNRPSGLFKAPSLINIWDEALLFHDGSFTDLPSLVDYKASFLSINLTEEEKAALLEYLKTL